MSRKRGENFSQQERAYIIELIRDKKDILEGKKIDASTCQKRNAVWKSIAENVAANFPDKPKRNEKQIKDFWRRMKIKAKSEATKVKKTKKSTGGGEKESEVTEESQVVIDVIGPDAISPAHNTFDDDAAPTKPQPGCSGENIQPNTAQQSEDENNTSSEDETENTAPSTSGSTAPTPPASSSSTGLENLGETQVR